MQTINHTELMKLGFPEHTARDIIKQAKLIAVRQFEESRACLLYTSPSPRDA